MAEAVVEAHPRVAEASVARRGGAPPAQAAARTAECLMTWPQRRHSCALRRRSPVNLAQLSLDLLAGGKPANPNWPPHQESYNSEGSAEEAMNPATSMETAS